MIGIYFSGTGNTKHCVEEFVKEYTQKGTAVSIEEAGVCEAILRHDMLVFGYPVYFSNMPKIVRDFITDNQTCFKGKRVIVVATMGLFSGYGFIKRLLNIKRSPMSIGSSVQAVAAVCVCVR